MPLNASSSVVLHNLQNLTLILIAAIFTPLLTGIVLISEIVSPFTSQIKDISQRQKCRQISQTRRTILVTGVGMSKGLTIARSLYQAGHRVIGADFEPHHIPVCGRFSKALSRFYRVTRPKPGSGSEGVKCYVDDMLHIVKAEHVDLWISCSGVASAIEDGLAKEAVEKSTSCKAVQFNSRTMATLHEKDSFIQNTQRLNLNVPDTHLITSISSALSILHPQQQQQQQSHYHPSKRYILKYVGTNDSLRANMTLLPLPTLSQTTHHLNSLSTHPSPSHPFVLQHFITGPEFCTHSILISNTLRAFTACSSSELLMHYQSLPPTSALFKTFLHYTNLYAQRMEPGFTGHFSLDFMVEENAANGQITDLDTLMKCVYPIECNPRAHTAAVLFASRSEELAEVYLSVLDKKGDSCRMRKEEIVIPREDTPGYYWVGHDVVELVLMPLVAFLTLSQDASVGSVLSSWKRFLEHLIWWRDGTYEVWDPWPLWALYVVYWPGMFWVSLVTQSWWSRCNVSTTKMFKV